MIRNLNLLVFNVLNVVFLGYISTNSANNKKKDRRTLDTTLSDTESEQEKENNLKDGGTNYCAFTTKVTTHLN